MEIPEFKARLNRFGQFVTKEMQEQRYIEVMRQLDAMYGPASNFEAYTYDWRTVGKGKNKRDEKYISRTETVNKSEYAKWDAEQI